MGQTITIRMELDSAEEVEAARQVVLASGSGLTEASTTGGQDKQWNADPGIWLDVTAIVISSIGAAESLFNLSSRFRRRQERTGELPAPGLTIIVDGTAYRIKDLEPEAIERLINDDVA